MSRQFTDLPYEDYATVYRVSLVHGEIIYFWVSSRGYFSFVCPTVQSSGSIRQSSAAIRGLVG